MPEKHLPPPDSGANRLRSHPGGRRAGSPRGILPKWAFLSLGSEPCGPSRHGAQTEGLVPSQEKQSNPGLLRTWPSLF